MQPQPVTSEPDGPYGRAKPFRTTDRRSHGARRVSDLCVGDSFGDVRWDGVENMRHEKPFVMVHPGW